MKIPNVAIINHAFVINPFKDRIIRNLAFADQGVDLSARTISSGDIPAN